MTISEALALLRERYVEEVDGVITGAKATQYQEACKKFPIVMTIAHQRFVQEKAKE